MFDSDIHDIRELTRTGAIPVQAPPAEGDRAGGERTPRSPSTPEIQRTREHRGRR